MAEIDLAELRRSLAAIEHERWSHWQRWMHDQGYRGSDGSLRLPADLVERWERQIGTPYAHLTQREQASDMEQVDRYWPHIQALVGRLSAVERGWSESGAALADSLLERARLAEMLEAAEAAIDRYRRDVGQLVEERTAAEARVAALQAEVQRQMDVARRLDALLEDQSANRQRIVALEAAGNRLAEYADHLHECPYQYSTIVTDDDCTCGYLAALAAWEGR